MLCFFLFITNKEKQVGLRGQCGGIGYNGSTDCVSGLTCFVQNTQYSMCEINCQAGWLCSTTTLTTNSIITITSIASVTNLAISPSTITSTVVNSEQSRGKSFKIEIIFLSFIR